MIKIGIDKSNNSFRKFYFDDSQVLTSNPPKYKIWYVDDEEDYTFIECSKVFAIKNAPDEMQQTSPSPSIEKIDGTDLVAKEPTPIITTKEEIEKNNIVVDQPKPKRKPGRPKKVSEPTPSPTTKMSKFEYKILDEPIDDLDDFENMLNEYGDDGWEVCGFEIYKIGGILSTNMNMICILKRIKQ